MAVHKRYLEGQVKSDLQEKMVFVGGPRQVGKTTLARSVLGSRSEGYLNWDIATHRERILRGEWPVGPLWVFDELHKYRRWREMLKGIYDQFHPRKKVLVTGSARLDWYRYGGDSLQGRYHYLRLHPLSVAELGLRSSKEFQDLLLLGGFPEPYFRGSVRAAKRWSREYRTRLVEEDVRTLEGVQELGTLELLMMRLPALVGSPLSVNALREDLQVSHRTVSRWMAMLERLYAIFRLPPFGAPRIRAVRKEQKHYHMDWSLPEELPARFENLVASHLLKWVDYRQDTEGAGIDLRYFRDIDGREVDFVVCEKGKPLIAVECKWGDADVSRSLRYFKAKFPDIEAWQISAEGRKDYVSRDAIRVAPAMVFLKNLI